MKWNEMNWNEMNWNETNWNEIKWNELKWNEMKWNELKWTEMKWNELKWNELKWNELNCQFVRFVHSLDATEINSDYTSVHFRCLYTDVLRPNTCLVLSRSGWPRRVQTISAGGCPETTHLNIVVWPGSKRWFVSSVSKTGARIDDSLNTSASPRRQNTHRHTFHDQKRSQISNLCHLANTNELTTMLFPNGLKR